MLTLVICLVLIFATPIHADNVELMSTKTRQFTCPGDLVTFTCRVFQSSSLEWRSPLITQTTSYLATDTPPRVLNRGPLTISLLSVSGTPLNANFTSTLRVTASRAFMRTDTTVMCLSGTLESKTDNFTVAEIPTTPLNVAVDAERTSRGGGNTVIRLHWMRPQNFRQFDIDRYQINITSTSGIQNMTTACGQCTSTLITVSENTNNVQMNTTFTVTIAARNRCGETGPTATASYTLINCGDPVVPVNGFIETFQNTSEGAEIVFKCNTSVLPSTRITATCASNGRWTPDPADLTCTFDCGAPVAPQRGSLESYTSTTEGSEVFYRCNQHLVPEGRMRANCTRNGWSPNPADQSCAVVNCRMPFAPGNGYIANIRSRLGSGEIFFRCNPGFVPTGRMRAVCLSDGVSVDGSWTPDPADLVCNASNVDCGDPLTLASGVIVEAYNSTAVNSDIFFQCQQPSDHSASCGGDGRWSPDPSQVECRMPMPNDTTLATDVASISCSTSVTIAASVSCAVSFILGALVGAVVHYCTVRKKCDGQKAIAHKQKNQKPAPVYEDVTGLSQSQNIKLKENVAYGPVQQ